MTKSVCGCKIMERRILVQKFPDGRWWRVALYEPHESDATAKMAARQHPVLPLLLRDQHLTTEVPCSHRAWPEEWAEPTEKVLEKQADMRAAGVRVRSEGARKPEICASGFRAAGERDSARFRVV